MDLHRQESRGPRSLVKRSVEFQCGGDNTHTGMLVITSANPEVSNFLRLDGTTWTRSAGGKVSGSLNQGGRQSLQGEGEENSEWLHHIADGQVDEGGAKVRIIFVVEELCGMLVDVINEK